MESSKIDGVEATPKIQETLTKVRNLSFEEKKEGVYDENKINALLDKILDFKKSLTKKAETIEDVVEKIEKLTWYNDVDVDSEDLMKINDVISAIRDLHYSFKRQCPGLNKLRDKGIATAEIKNFKSAMQDLNDSASDLESRFFFLPKLSSFQETTKELSLLK